MTFFDITSSILPSPETGWAAPVLVPGAMAATSAATVMMKPAEAALIFHGKQLTVKPLSGKVSRLSSFSMWQ